MAFDPCGRPEKGGTGKSPSAPGSSLGFQGAHTDATTGSVILCPRQYDPTTARFTSPDVYAAGELDLALGTDELTGNRYLLAGANPVAYYEDGHWPCFKGIGWCDKNKNEETVEEKEARESRRRAFEDIREQLRNHGLNYWDLGLAPYGVCRICEYRPAIVVLGDELYDGQPFRVCMRCETKLDWSDFDAALAEARRISLHRK